MAYTSTRTDLVISSCTNVDADPPVADGDREQVGGHVTRR